jgi:hypothetical protein
VKKKTVARKQAAKAPARKKVVKPSSGRKVAKAAAKKKVVKPKVAKPKVAKRRAAAKRPPGYVYTESGLVVPEGSVDLVAAGKLSQGMARATKEIRRLVDTVVEDLSGTADVQEIELEASFSADGKFLGFGVGGAVTVRISIVPEGD